MPMQLFEAMYSIVGRTVTITSEGDSFTATANENDELVTRIDEGGECIYQKQ